jgi:hypothetical protein
MKTNVTKNILGAIGLLMACFTFGTAVSSAQSSNLGGGRLEGTWNARVSIRNCSTGSEIRSFDSIGTFMTGGTFLDSTSGTAQALKTPGQGIWTHVGGNTYRFKFKSFTFDPAGNFTGWTVIHHEATLNNTADAYTSAGTAQVYAPNGTLVFTGCSTTTATRFN